MHYFSSFLGAIYTSNVLYIRIYLFLTDYCSKSQLQIGVLLGHNSYTNPLCCVFLANKKTVCESCSEIIQYDATKKKTRRFYPTGRNHLDAFRTATKMAVAAITYAMFRCRLILRCRNFSSSSYCFNNLLAFCNEDPCSLTVTLNPASCPCSARDCFFASVNCASDSQS